MICVGALNSTVDFYLEMQLYISVRRKPLSNLVRKTKGNYGLYKLPMAKIATGVFF